MTESLTFIPTTTISDGTKTVKVGKVGHGIMMMTTTPNPVPDEICFESIKASLDAVPEGSKMLINSGEFYGLNPREANLELLARFFEKYPEYADKVFLSVKGGVRFDSGGLQIDGSSEGVRSSVNNILSKLRGTKRLDLYEVARIDGSTPVEETIKAITELIAEEKLDFIGMSECKAETLRRGHAVHPVAMIEIEVSPWSYDEKVKDVIATSKELGVAIAAYSPLGRGFLAGKFESANDLAENDFRRTFDRYLPGNIEANKAIVEGIKAIATQKGITAAQLCIAWVCALGDHVIPIPGSSHVSRTKENIAAAAIELTAEEFEAVNKVLADHPVQGSRYRPGTDEENHLWG